MSQLREWFDKAVAISDPVERSQAVCDLAFDAEQMVRAGRRVEAIELFELLAALDRYDDLLQPAIERADDHLVALGVRALPPLNEVVGELQTRFARLAERERLLVVATTLVREWGRRRPQSWSVAADMLTAAEAIRPLTGKEMRLRAEIHRRVQQQAESGDAEDSGGR